MSAAARAPREGAARAVPPSPGGATASRSATTKATTATAKAATATATPKATGTPARTPTATTGSGHAARPLRALPSRPVRTLPSRPVRAGATRATGPAPRVPSVPDLRLLTGGAGLARATGARRAPFVLLVVVLLVATTIALLVLNTAIAVNSLRAGELRSENAEKAEEVQELERQVVQGGAPAQLAAAAVAAGLVPAGTAAYLVVGPDGTATLRGTPEPAPAPETAPPAANGG
ncbi:hypothetical protein [Geodermatophilus nigrescens]|uniref:Cell division protein FtsI (Penicillin-binding protein 3) n=1 Tax=Geodermatophilus nigrescens TaxID=1070870 RepID=A0A1M5R529_9ACTN|nr:hypothetical protein [Geodermatophilus nigrescens]SHH21485.1 hypothetical protein SAMN05444351_4313 [Geodermatophilus nigrescens]